MDKRRIKRKSRILAAALVAALGFGCVPTAYAASISDAQNKKNEAQSELDAQNNKINEIETQKDSLQSEIDKLDADLVNIITTIDILEGELATKEQQLEELGVQLADAEEAERTQYDNMKKRIRYMYENGNSSLFEIVLGAEDFADFLNRVEYAGEVYGHDREMLTTYQETVQQVADLKQQVEGEKAELEEMHLVYDQQRSEYEAMLTEKKQSMSDFDTQLANAKQLAAEYQSVIAEQNRLIRQEEQRRKEEEQRRKEEEQKQNQNQNNNGNNDNKDNKGDSKDDSGKTDGGKNPPHTTNVSGSELANYACQFVGNPYVFGGTSLTNGADCSGFVMSVYANYGISLPHSSIELQSVGSEVSYSNAQPGDIICYAGHVASYIGGGQIENASSPAPYPIGGIKTKSATYRQILCVRRVL